MEMQQCNKNEFLQILCRETPDLELKYACSIVWRLHSAFVISRLVSPIKSKQLCLCTAHLQVISSCIHLARTPRRGKGFQLHPVIESISVKWQTA